MIIESNGSTVTKLFKISTINQSTFLLFRSFALRQHTPTSLIGLSFTFAQGTPTCLRHSGPGPRATASGNVALNCQCHCRTMPVGPGRPRPAAVASATSPASGNLSPGPLCPLPVAADLQVNFLSIGRGPGTLRMPCGSGRAPDVLAAHRDTCGPTVVLACHNRRGLRRIVASLA